jgi:hypothetical protein
MTDRLRTWDKICNAGWPTLLIGNGLSINFWSSFSYKRLLGQAELNQAARQLFDDFGTTNFEVVLEALWHAERTLAALGRPTSTVNTLYRHVQNQLVGAVRRVHDPWEVVPAQSLTELATALSAHQMVFTLNYDLLTRLLTVRRLIATPWRPNSKAIRDADHFRVRRSASISTTTSAAVAVGCRRGADERSTRPTSP